MLTISYISLSPTTYLWIDDMEVPFSYFCLGLYINENINHDGFFFDLIFLLNIVFMRFIYVDG